MAGGEMTTLASQHSDRLGGLVYLDALADPREGPGSDPRFGELLKMVPAPLPPACTPDRNSFAAYRAFLQCQMGFAFPEAEVRADNAVNSNGTVGGYTTPQSVFNAIGEGQRRRDYSKVRVPALALFETPKTSLDHLEPGDPQPRNDEERRALLEGSAIFKSYVDRWVGNLRKSVPDARIVQLPRAGHFVFITREADVLREIRAFVASFK